MRQWKEEEAEAKALEATQISERRLAAYVSLLCLLSTKLTYSGQHRD